MVAGDANPPTGSGLPSAARAVAAALAIGRVSLATVLLVAPQAALGPLGFRGLSPTTVAVARLAGVRDLVLGLEACAALLGSDPRRLRRASLAAAAADLGDAAVFCSAIAAGDETESAGRTGLAAALPAALAGLWVGTRRARGEPAGDLSLRDLGFFTF